MTKDSEKRGVRRCRECRFHVAFWWLNIERCWNFDAAPTDIRSDAIACELFEGRVNELQAD